MKIDNESRIIAAIICFENILNDFQNIGQDFLDNDIDYRYVKRLQTIDIKLCDLINEMKEDLR